MSNAAANNVGGEKKGLRTAANSPANTAVTKAATPSQPVPQTRAQLVGGKFSSASGQAKAQELKAKKDREDREAKERAEREAAAEATKPKKPQLPPMSKASDAARKQEAESRRKKAEERQEREAKARAKAEKAAEEAAAAAAARVPKVSKASDAALAAAQGKNKAIVNPQPKKRYGKLEVSVRELLDAVTRRPISLLSERPGNSDVFEETSVRFRSQKEDDEMEFETVLYRDSGMLERHIQNMIKTHRDPATALFDIFVIIVNGTPLDAPETVKAYGYIRKGKVPDEQSLYACLTMPSPHLGMFAGKKEAQNSLRTALDLAKGLQKLHGKGIVFHGSLSPEIITVAHIDGDTATFNPKEGVASIREVVVDTHSFVLFKDLSASLPSRPWCAPELCGLLDKKWSERTSITGSDIAGQLKAREQADIFTLGAIFLALCHGKIGFNEDVQYHDQLLHSGDRTTNVPNLHILGQVLLIPDARLKGKISLQRVIEYLSGDGPKKLMMSKDQIDASRANITQFLLSPSNSGAEAAPSKG